MNENLGETWRQGLSVLEAQGQHLPGDVAAWRGRTEIRVLRFLLRRYASTAALYAATSPASASPHQCSALRIPDHSNQRVRPAPHERAEILGRIHVAGEQARSIGEPRHSLWGEVWGTGKRQLEASAYRDVLARRR